MGPCGAGRKIGGHETMMISIVFMLFILLFFLPFLPGILEIVRKEDADPLYIPMNYIKDPRYFGKSFKELLRQATDGFTASPGICDVQLSKKESLEITGSMDILNAEEVYHLLYVQGDLVSRGNAQFHKEVFVTGDASMGPNNIIQVLAADGNVTIGTDVQLKRWLDADGDINIGAGCNLGISASSGRKLHLGQNCHFRRLYGTPIATGDNGITTIDHFESSLPPMEHLPPEQSFVRIKDHTIPPGTIMGKNIVFPQDVQIGYGSILRGNIKSYGKLVLEDNVIIDGSVFADGDIIIGRGAIISGHVFSQKTVYISGGTVISRANTIKSVIGKKSVRIEENVTIYGYVTTEGEGMVV
jgi:predicted acyltransferase (DUF342 family)